MVKVDNRPEARGPSRRGPALTSRTSWRARKTALHSVVDGKGDPRAEPGPGESELLTGHMAPLPPFTG